MDDIIISEIKNEKEIELLEGKKSFNYIFDKSTIKLLKKNFVLKDSLYLLAKKNDKFVAFCSIDRDWWEDNFFFIREILVDSMFQKFGMGQCLIDKCIEHSKNRGAIGIVTETSFENYPMQKLCEKVGFMKWNNPQWNEGFTYKLIF
ncbi:MAG: GNAT family N-acetyltransferase [Candidatus Magasanikbacteria bacterium]